MNIDELQFNIEKLSTFEEKYDYLKKQYNERRSEYCGNSYVDVLNNLIDADVDPQFILYVSKNEVLVQTSMTIVKLLKKKNTNLWRCLIDNKIIVLKNLQPYYLIHSFKMTKFLYDTYSIPLSNDDNWFEILFNDECTDNKYNHILNWLQSLGYTSNKPLNVRYITEKLVKFCLENNFKIFQNVLDRNVKYANYDLQAKLSEWGYEYVPRKTFAQMTIDEKREYINKDRANHYNAIKFIIDNNDEDLLREFYAIINNTNLPRKILQSNDVGLIRVMVSKGVRMEYTSDDYSIFNLHYGFRIWKYLHEKNLVQWSEAEMQHAINATNYEFTKYALQNCPADIQSKVIDLL